MLALIQKKIFRLKMRLFCSKNFEPEAFIGARDVDCLGTSTPKKR